MASKIRNPAQGERKHTIDTIIHSKAIEWENFSGCLAPSRHVLRETYRITKIRGKVFTIECKIMKAAKVFPLKSFAINGIH